jgi:cytosine/adenosine deaminase-related metal-dependent hydrolase
MAVYKAKYVLLPGGEVLKNGIVKTRNGVVTEISEKTNEQVDHDIDGWITPGFVNAHCHLELSHLENKVPQKTGLPNFIQSVQSSRQSTRDEIETAILDADRKMWESGISAVGDICNGTDSIACKNESPIAYHNFVEVFSFDPNRAHTALERAENVMQSFIENGLLQTSLTPHAPYSVSEKLFRLLLHHKGCYDAPLTIHNQETESENELYREGKGAMADQLKRFGLDLSHFRIRGTNSLPAYLVHFSKCSNTQLVHNTYSNDEDINWALGYSNQLYWCACPNANEYIEDRLPDYPLWIKKGLKVTLGTDSLASNHGLDMIDEMRTIQRAYPEIRTDQMLVWATKNGADFLRMNLGRLNVGTAPGIVAIYEVGENGALTDNSFSKRLE